jgi:hypothetical protein
MPSRTYELIAEALCNRQQVLCDYDGYPRELCPIVLGHSKGEEKALTFQFGGESNSGLPPKGEWRCLFLSKVRNVRLREGSWRSGDSHTQPQGCVEDVDLDINPDSPYNPRRRLDDLR